MELVHVCLNIMIMVQQKIAKLVIIHVRLAKIQISQQIVIRAPLRIQHFIEMIHQIMQQLEELVHVPIGYFK